jgi:predicted alpha/beta hydrolase
MSGELNIVSSDGVRHTARIALSSAPLAPVFLCLPAMGASADYYQPFAARMAADGVGTSVLLDLRGQGRSSARARQGDQFGYREILELDLPQAIETLRIVFRSRRLYLAGHSLGGQLGLILSARLRAAFDGLVLIAAGTAYWRDWPRRDRPRAWAATAAIRAASRVLPWYPGRSLGFGGNQPRRLMRDWSRVARKGVYRPEGSSFDYERAAQDIRLPVLSIGVRGDPVAPPSAREALLGRAPRARVRRIEIDGVRSDRPWKRHFSWARQPGEAVQAISRWVQEVQ